MAIVKYATSTQSYCTTVNIFTTLNKSINVPGIPVNCFRFSPCCAIRSKNVHCHLRMTVKLSPMILVTFSAAKLICWERKLTAFIWFHHKLIVIPQKFYFTHFLPLQNRMFVLSSWAPLVHLDPIPTWLLKLCIDELLPVLTEMVNLSIRGELVPVNWKCALVKPLFKKLDLEPVLNNFRPVSNLSFISKCAEKLVFQQLLSHCSENALLPSNQSAYRKHHFTKTCLLKVQNHILLSMDWQEVSLLVLLDLSAAFDTIDHKLLRNLSLLVLANS